MLSIEAVEKGFRLMESELVVEKDSRKPSNDPEKLARWSLLFKEISDADFQAACLRACQTLRFFPKIVDFGELLFGDLESRAQIAFEKARECVRKLGRYGTWFKSDFDGDGAALYASNAVGIEVLCSMDAENRPFRRVEFIKIYKAAVSEGQSIDSVAGICETQNRARGIDTGSTLALYGRSVLSSPPELVGICADALPLGETPKLIVKEIPATLAQPNSSDDDDNGQSDEKPVEKRFGMLLSKFQSTTDAQSTPA